MTHQMTLYMADLRMNELMRAFDLRPKGKWYAHPVEVDFETSTPLTDEYFQNIIDKSNEVLWEPPGVPGNIMKIEGMWIPAIRYQNNHYFHHSVKILSDGKHEMFVAKVGSDEEN